MRSAPESIHRLFRTIGARATVLPYDDGSWLGVQEDRHGERFVIWLQEEASVEVLNRDRGGHHLVVMLREGSRKSRFLCGFDERHWFVAAIPESATNAVTVAQAKAALQPPEVRRLAVKLRVKQRLRRRTPAYLRQGEWFFVPAPDLAPAKTAILHNEPLSRGQGNMHWMQYAYRTGGEMVFFTRNHPRGLNRRQFEMLDEDERRGLLRQMVRDADVFAMGRVSHPDHATVVLRGWHRVLMNTERDARAMRHVAFLD